MLIHWWFNGKLRDVNDKVDSFIVDVINIFARNLDSSAINSTPPATQTIQTTAQQVIVNTEPQNTDINDTTTASVEEKTGNNTETPKAKPAKKAKPVDDDI